MSENKFYVYVYLDTRKPGDYQYGEYCFDYEPFYVGKGWGRRWKDHIKEAEKYDKNQHYYNIYKIRKINKIIKETEKRPIIIKVKENLLEKDAFLLEKYLIKIIRKNNNNLTNLTDGGDGKCNELNSNKKCKKLCEYIKKYDKMPSSNSYLNKWYNTKKKALKNKGTYIFYKSDQEIANNYGYFDLFSDNFYSLEKDSNIKIEKLCKWIIKNNKTPNRYSKNKEEKNMANLFNNKKKLFNKEDCIFYESDQKIIEYYGLLELFNFLNNELNSNKMCQKLCEWIIKNNKMIRWDTKIEEEKILYRWWHYKRNSKKNGKFYKSDQIIANSYNLIDLFDIKSLEQISNINTINICEWIKKNNKKPLLTSKNEAEQKLGKILSRRRQIFKGTHSGIFYKSDQKIAESYGYFNLFKP